MLWYQSLSFPILFRLPRSKFCFSSSFFFLLLYSLFLFEFLRLFEIFSQSSCHRSILPSLTSILQNKNGKLEPLMSQIWDFHPEDKQLYSRHAGGWKGNQSLYSINAWYIDRISSPNSRFILWFLDSSFFFYSPRRFEEMRQNLWTLWRDFWVSNKIKH